MRANAVAHGLAGPVPGPFSDRVAALARELGVFICIGLTEKVDRGIYNAAVLRAWPRQLGLIARLAAARRTVAPLRMTTGEGR